MTINSLEAMETIVDNNKSLSWDGWDVIESTVNPTGWMNKDGAFINNKWNIQKRYNLTKEGWAIPNRLAKKNEQR